MFYQPEPTKIDLLCGVYPRFGYPKGFGIRSRWNGILHTTRSGKMTEKGMYELLDFPSFLRKIDEIFSGFRCTIQDVREWARKDLDKYNWDEDEDGEKTKIETIISLDNDLHWWSTIGTGDDVEGRIEFEENMASAMANTIVNAGLSLHIAGGKKNQKFYQAITSFIKNVENEFDVRWMEQLRMKIDELKDELKDCEEED
jgi:hypothetical protein